jgi:peptide/nickel transport system substrate-binding protein
MRFSYSKNNKFISFIYFILVLSSCSQQIENQDQFTSTSGRDQLEAPLLARQVAQGSLPPLEDRLPETPLVAKHPFEGYEEEGIYGGVWHHMHTNTDLGSWKMIGGYAPIIRWNWACTDLEPGLAEAWAFNEDGSELTLKLRKGLKWSDGQPYTSASFAFWYELCLDDRHRYAPPVWCLVDGKPMTVETPDDWTIVMKFAGPNWLVPLWLATGFWWCEEYNIPEQFMKQYHPDHNSEYTDFVEFEKKNLSHRNENRPSLWPWKISKIDQGGFQIHLERNPYYYVVDDLGRQLPYIDKVVTSLVPESQVRVLKVLAGDVDCQFRSLELRDLSLFLEGRQKGNYKIKMWKSASGAEPAINLNWSDNDPVLRQLIRNQNFRKALSLGIDREKCNAIAYRGLLEPQAATVSEEAWHFVDKEGAALFDLWKKSDTDFNLELGNRLLDDMGLTKRDEADYRVRPDGQRLSIVLDTPSSKNIVHENDIALIVAEGWEALGIEVVIYTPPGAELKLRRDLGEFTVHLHSEGEMDLFTYPDWVFPTSGKYWHPQVGKWYESGGTKGEAPTGVMKEFLDIYDQIKREKDLQKRHTLVQEAVKLHIDQGPFHLGTVGRMRMPIIVKNTFHNVPDEGILGPWAIVAPGISFPEQYYMDPQ